MSVGNGKGTLRRVASVAAGVTSLMVLAAVTAPMAAAQVSDTAVHVSYGDLDLSTAAGAAKLYDRLQSAAEQVCLQADERELSRYEASLRCEQKLVAEAVNNIHSPQLAAVYAAKTHHGAHSPA
jgi:UrcA family protein